MTLLFSYGSNGTAQLRQRIGRPTLTGRPARLPGHTVVFHKHSRNWGGGVASIHPDPEEGAAVLGSVAELTEEEMCKVDVFEAGYTRTRVVLEGGTEAVAYVADNPQWDTPPSESYLTAMHVHLREHWPDDRRAREIPVRRVAAAAPSGVETLRVWVPPASLEECRTVEALLIEVNGRAGGVWVMPRDLAGLVSGRLAGMDSASAVLASVGGDILHLAAPISSDRS